MQKQIFSLFLRTAWQYPFRTSGAIFGSATAGLVGQFIGPYFIAQLLERLQSGHITLHGSWPLLTAYIATQVYGEVIAWRGVLFLSWTMETAAQKDLYQRIFTALTQQSLSFHANRFSGALVSQSTKLINAFERFWDTIVFEFVPALVSIISAVTILSFVFWQYAVVLLVLSIVFVLCVFFGSRFLTARNKEEAQASTATNGYIADVVTNVMAIKSYGQERYEDDRLEARTQHWRDKSLANMRGFLGVSSVYASLLAILNISALVVAIWAAEHQVISIAAVYLAITYTFNVARRLWELNHIMRSYNRIIGDAHDMTEIFAMRPSVIDTSDKKLTVSNGQIEFKAISFAHEDNDIPLFHDFSLSINGGERIGLVGRSGSGKSTLTRLLLRFTNIDSGEILIDGQSISEVTQQSLRQAIAYVPQEPLLFHRSLRENIAYGKPDADEAAIRRAAKQAHALEFIETLPHGFDTIVGERGVKLSGGQRQRIAIARAILKDAPILVLDEATSSLDSESERLIQAALDELMKNRTSIVIAHRLSTIASLNKIVVLENGRIAEQGSHDELLRAGGAYASLWEHQSGGFIAS